MLFSVNVSNLMNIMMEFRKCCNYFFLINGVEDKVFLEYNLLLVEKIVKYVNIMIEVLGKFVFIYKFLFKLKFSGYKVFIFL